MIYKSSNSPVEPGIFERVMERLKHRGPDGCDIHVAGHVSMGHWHFWTTPEEFGERQPLAVNGMPFKIVLDGRLDNRPDLFSQLNIHPVEGEELSDAVVILHAYARWGEDCFSHFIGEYALVILDERLGQLICARDGIGTRALFYAWQGTQFIVASEAWAVAGAMPSLPKLNEMAAALYFGFQAPEDGQTLFKDIFTLLPGHFLLINGSLRRLSKFWQPDPSKKLRYKTDEEYAGHFLSLLEESVKCRMRATTPVGVLMSGGLDSTSIASLAARMVAPLQLTTISYVFDKFSQCDERKYIDAVATKYNTHSIQIPCDDLYPFHNWPDWTLNPNYPISNLYMPIRERAHKRAHQEGMRVVLTGDYGDHLYSGAEDWLTDLLIEGSLWKAGKKVVSHFRKPGFKQQFSNVYLRRVARRILDLLPFGQRIRRRSSPPAWLTPFAARFLPLKNQTSDRLNGVTALLIAQSSAMASLFSSKDELELRCPYRDRRLVEFMLAIPAYQLYQPGVYRMVLRNAMRGILPEVIRTRIGKTSLVPMYSYGLELKRNELETFFSVPNPVWKEYVDADWLLPKWPAVFAPNQDGSEKVVPWLCVAFEQWYKYINSLS